MVFEFPFPLFFVMQQKFSPSVLKWQIQHYHMRLGSYEHLRKHLVYDHTTSYDLGGYCPPGCLGHIMVMDFAVTRWL